jgi:hypothetical protein
VTDAGRYLITFFVLKLDGRALPVSARDMTDREQNSMAESKKTSISGASSYRDVGEFWDQHDLTDYPGGHDVQMEVEIASSAIYFAVEKSLAENLRVVAHDQGVSPESLLNQLVEEHVADGASSK